ncbi:hypothetical protein H6H03_09755 [Nostoc paludosum FACHB-159]|uniref:Uncharacterized protein n=1 Tax=Nostoc paludosum FACHB-159 TaxID=2692908 RepID=A0ABR8K638_9NOSO|nr:hypothetical protein [Nostoc paludosum]MBD2734199.1 hypothetical protein [Nostoc paludosum FACHB-159]
MKALLYNAFKKQLELLATRKLRIEKFKQAMWERQLALDVGRVEQRETQPTFFLQYFKLATLLSIFQKSNMSSI